MTKRCRDAAAALREPDRQALLDQIAEATSPLVLIGAAATYLRVETALAGPEDAWGAARAAAGEMTRLAEEMRRCRTEKNRTAMAGAEA